jgi:hypothetical protein
MRESGKPAGLGELLGSAANKQNLGLKDLPELLGEKLPELPMNRIGKFRLINALSQRFGPGFRNIPMVSGILKEFDQQMNDENVIRQNKKGRN